MGRRSRLYELWREFGVVCAPLLFDVADPEAVKAAFRELFAQTKVLDVLVNNAGILDDALIGMVTPAQVERTFASNSFSVLYCSQYAARMMQRAGGGSADDGGRHLLCPLAIGTTASLPEISALMRVLAGHLPTLDIAPALNPAQGCISLPGTRLTISSAASVTVPS